MLTKPSDYIGLFPGDPTSPDNLPILNRAIDQAEVWLSHYVPREVLEEALEALTGGYATPEQKALFYAELYRALSILEDRPSSSSNKGQVVREQIGNVSVSYGQESSSRSTTSAQRYGVLAVHYLGLAGYPAHFVGGVRSGDPRVEE